MYNIHIYDCDCFVDCFLSGRSGSFQPRFTHLSSPVDGLQSQAKTEMQDFGPRVDGCWWVNWHTNNTNVLSVYIIHASACVCVYLHHVCMCMHTWHVCRCVFEKEMDTGSSYIFSSDYIIKFFYWSWMSRWRRSKWSVLLSEDFSIFTLKCFFCYYYYISISIYYNIKFIKGVLFRSTQ